MHVWVGAASLLYGVIGCPVGFLMYCVIGYSVGAASLLYGVIGCPVGSLLYGVIGCPVGSLLYGVIGCPKLSGLMHHMNIRVKARNQWATNIVNTSMTEPMRCVPPLDFSTKHVKK